LTIMVGMETISYEELKGRPNGDNLDMSERIKELEFAGEKREKIRQ